MTNLYIRNLKIKGRGVFTTGAIEPNQLIESCPVILIEEETDKQLLKSTILVDYLFYWNDEKTISAIALGYGSLYNHAIKANARYVMNTETGTVKFYSVVFIPAHHEITINYNGVADAASLQWFQLRNIPYAE